MKRRLLLPILPFVLLVCLPTAAQIVSGSDLGATPAAETVPAAPPARHQAQVVAVSSLTDKHQDTIHLGDHVLVQVKHLAQMLQDQKRKPEELRLFINNIALTNIKPLSCDLMTGTLVFHLDRRNDKDAYWKMFYSSLGTFKYPAVIGIGSEESQLAISYPAKGEINLLLVRQKYLFWGIGLILALGGVLVWLGANSNLVRNDNSLQEKIKPLDQLTTPFSIAKSQLALWTYLVVSGYFIIWVVTGELPFIPENLLALLGISLTSDLVAKGIDNKQGKLGSVRHQDQPSIGFFGDIISDEHGLSMPRLQFLLFNLVIAGYFIRTVVKEWALPSFDLTTLTLLGLSGAGYLAYKTSENANPSLIPHLAPAPEAPVAPAALGPEALGQEVGQTPRKAPARIPAQKSKAPVPV